MSSSCWGDTRLPPLQRRRAFRPPRLLRSKMIDCTQESSFAHPDPSFAFVYSAWRPGGWLQLTPCTPGFQLGWPVGGTAGGWKGRGVRRWASYSPAPSRWAAVCPRPHYLLSGDLLLRLWCLFRNCSLSTPSGLGEIMAPPSTDCA